MKTLLVSFTVTLILASTASFSQWSEPVQLTFGPDEDGEIALCNSWDLGLFTRKDWMAFTRTSSTGKNIYLMRTVDFSYSWVDSLYPVTADSMGLNEHPTLAEWSPWFATTQHWMLVWQFSIPGGTNLRYSHNPGTGWGPPLFITTDSVHDRFPHVAARDSGFGVVWERNGTVLYAEFGEGAWTIASPVTPVGDSTNHHPRLKYLGYPPLQTPIVIWQKQEPDLSHKIMYSIRTANGWSAPDTVYGTGNNLNPDFSMLGPGGYVNVVWQSHTGTHWEVLTRGANNWSGNIIWESVENISSEIPGNSESPSFTVVPFISVPKEEQRTSWLFGAGTWMVDSQQIAVVNFPPYHSLLTAGPGAINRDPRVSSGVLDEFFNMRVWCVWKANTGGQWKLYGSSIPISLGDVEDDGLPSHNLRLHQNYPNPFNPSTTLSFDIQHSAFVILKVYDILGREVATLVNERKEPGTHRVEFNAEGLPSGVYVYRIQADDFAGSRKMVLIG